MIIKNIDFGPQIIIDLKTELALLVSLFQSEQSLRLPKQNLDSKT